jgi:U3 small nucleolar RNA-associated protein 24
MFFKYNAALGPPYQLLIDTNFINFAVKNKLEIVRAAMDCLLAKVIPCITDCVMAELEKLGPKYRIALRQAKVHFCYTQILPCHNISRKFYAE